MSLFFWLHSLAWAEPMTFRVALDDREAKRYSQPVLEIGGIRVLFADDGAQPGDVPGDGIWVASTSIDRRESIALKVTDPNAPLFQLAYTLPQASIATLQLRSLDGMVPLAIDQNAPPMPTEGPQKVDTLLVRAAPVMDAPEPEGNTQEIRFLVDDRQLQRLAQPRIRVNQNGVAMAPLVDDGRVLGDTPNDNIFHAKLLITPAEQILLTLEDEGQVIGQVTVSLPSERVVGAGVQIGASGLQLVQSQSTLAPTALVETEVVETQNVEAEFVPTNVVEARQVSRDLVVQAFAKEGSPPNEQIDGQTAQWLEIMFSSAAPLVMPTLRVGTQEVLLSDDGSQFEDIANDGLYVGRLLVPRGSTQEGQLTVDGQVLGQLTLFLPDSAVAQAVASVTPEGFAPFDRLDVLKKGEGDLPKVFKAAGVQGTSVNLESEAARTVQFQILLKGVFKGAPQAAVLGQGQELAQMSFESQSENVWVAEAELPRESLWEVQLDLDGERTETYVIPPAFQAVSLALQLEGGALKILDDVSLLSEAASIDELKVLRALSQPDATPAVLNQPMQLELVLDDRAGQMVKSPKLWVDGSGREPVIALDEGQDGDDEASDKQYTAILTVDYQPLIQLSFQNGDAAPTGHVVMLPENGPAALRALVTPVGLTAVEAQNADISVSAPLVVQAAPTGVDFQEGNGENLIEVTMILDDRILQKLSKPRLRVLQNESIVLNLNDDGKDADESAGDQIYSGLFRVEQAEFLKVAIDDEGQAVGQMTVFLPSSSSARIRMRTTDDSAGLKLLTEAIATGGGNAPTPVLTNGGGSGTGGVGVDRLAHVLWVGLTLFGLGFAYIRHVVHSKWEAEVAPLLRRLDAFLAQSEPSVEEQKAEEDDA